MGYPRTKTVEPFMFGNDAVVEKHTYLSGRDDKEDVESEEAED